MNIQSVIETMFPRATVRGQQALEVNGLAKNTVPANSEILAQGSQWHSEGDRRQFYLVRCEGVLVFLRICTAMAGSGYDEYAVIHQYAELPLDQAVLEGNARSYIERLG